MGKQEPSSRREFLQGRAAARALTARAQEAIDAVRGNLPRRESKRQVAHLEVSRRAMACDFVVRYHAAAGTAVTDAMLAALDQIERLEAQLSIYREQSEVSQINRNAARGPVIVERRLGELLAACRDLTDRTSGAFDITSGVLSRTWGFLRREGRMPDAEEIEAARERVGSHLWSLDVERQTVAFNREGVEINFNSIGKGYALDRVAESLAEQDVADYLWHGGRSSVLARGVNHADRRKAWTVGIGHPLCLDERVAEVHLRNQAMGTAGSGTQFFVHEGKRYGHVIDPRSGWPACEVYTATAITESAADADALATAFYVLGPGGTAEFCASHANVGAILICPGAGDDDIDLHSFNLSDDGWTRLSNL